MAVEFVMPKLGLTMEAGTIIEWLVAAGEQVEAGTAVLNIETDKVESEVEASASGVLHPLGEKGDTFACGDLIGWFLEAGEDPPARAAAPAPAQAADPAPGAAAASTPAAATPATATASGDRRLASPNARRVAALAGVDLATVAGTGPGGRIVSEDVELVRATGRTGATTISSTIAARQLADLLGVDLALVEPGGSDPRIDKSDVARHVRARLAAVADSPTDDRPALAPASQEPTGVVAMTGVRGTIAQRMYQSLQEMAQLTLTVDASMDAVVADRASRRAAGAAPGYTDYVIAATAAALRDHPIINSQITDDGVALLPEIHVGMAVALDGGLVVPVVHHADQLSIESIAEKTTQLAGDARAGSLQLTDLEGGTISVSTLGMYGVDAFTPVINPPNTAILGVGRLRDDVRWSDSAPVRTTVMTLSLTWDHRAFDGAPAAAFTADVARRLAEWGSS